MSAAVIETPRLVLRDWSEADIAPFIAHTNTTAVMRWLGGPLPEADIPDRLRARIMRWHGERGFTFWAVERKADKALLGFCGIKIADDAGSPVEGLYEIGWRLREDAWGQGYATEAARAVMADGFQRLTLPRILAYTSTDNARSQAVMARLGFVRRPALDFEHPALPSGHPLRRHIVFAAEPAG